MSAPATATAGKPATFYKRIDQALGNPRLQAAMCRLLGRVRLRFDVYQDHLESVPRKRAGEIHGDRSRQAW